MELASSNVGQEDSWTTRMALEGNNTGVDEAPCCSCNNTPAGLEG